MTDYTVSVRKLATDLLEGKDITIMSFAEGGDIFCDPVFDPRKEPTPPRVRSEREVRVASLSSESHNRRVANAAMRVNRFRNMSDEEAATLAEEKNARLKRNYDHACELHREELAELKAVLAKVNQWKVPGTYESIKTRLIQEIQRRISIHERQLPHRPMSISGEQHRAERLKHAEDELARITEEVRLGSDEYQASSFKERSAEWHGKMAIIRELLPSLQAL